MTMSLADSSLFAAFTAALSGEGDSCCGYQPPLQAEKPTITLATEKATTK